MAEASDSSSKIFGQTAAVRLGIALLLGYGLITGFAVYDKHRLSSVEKVDALTAVGDKAFFPVPKSFDPSAPLANFEGHSLYFVDWKLIQDHVMTRQGMDDGNSFSVYKMNGVKGAEASLLYLKIKDGCYVQTKMQ